MPTVRVHLNTASTSSKEHEGIDQIGMVDGVLVLGRYEDTAEQPRAVYAAGAWNSVEFLDDDE
jgi:hypothetical protein